MIAMIAIIVFIRVLAFVNSLGITERERDKFIQINHEHNSTFIIHDN